MTYHILPTLPSPPPGWEKLIIIIDLQSDVTFTSTAQPTCYKRIVGSEHTMEIAQMQTANH